MQIYNDPILVIFDGFPIFLLDVSKVPIYSILPYISNFFIIAQNICWFRSNQISTQQNNIHLDTTNATFHFLDQHLSRLTIHQVHARHACVTHDGDLFKYSRALSVSDTKEKLSVRLNIQICENNAGEKFAMQISRNLVYARWRFEVRSIGRSVLINRMVFFTFGE